METVQEPHGAIVVVDVEESSHHLSDDEKQRSSSSDSGSCIEIVKERRSPVSEVDWESEVPEIKVHLAKFERDCRICHMNLDAGNLDSGLPIELDCSCKHDVAVAHKQCAEAWFKIIKGNKHCEICGSIARNVADANEGELVEQWNQANDAAVATTAARVQPADNRNFWQGHRFLNFLLACTVFAFVISWLFTLMYPRNPVKGITFFLDFMTDEEKTSISTPGTCAGTASVPIVSPLSLKTSDSPMRVLLY